MCVLSSTSNHEYVNLQVGTMPDVVQPVSEEEESTQSKGQTGGSRDRKYSGQKSDGKENGQSNVSLLHVLTVISIYCTTIEFGV